MSDTFTKWLLTIVGTLVVLGVAASFTMTLRTSSALGIIQTEITHVKEALGEDTLADTLKNQQAQHSKHWQYNSQLRDYLNESRIKQGLPPMPTPNFEVSQ